MAKVHVQHTFVAYDTQTWHGYGKDMDFIHENKVFNMLWHMTVAYFEVMSGFHSFWHNGAAIHFSFGREEYKGVFVLDG